MPDKAVIQMTVLREVEEFRSTIRELATAKMAADLARYLITESINTMRQPDRDAVLAELPELSGDVRRAH